MRFFSVLDVANLIMYVIQRGHVKFEPTQTPGRISHDDETAYE